MTEDISKYTFDFDREVNEFIRYLGRKASNIAFVDVGVLLGLSKNPIVTLRPIAGKLVLDEDLTPKLDLLEKCYTRFPGTSSLRAPMVATDDDGNESVVGHVVFLRQEESFTTFHGEKYKDFLRLFALYHETAHALMPEDGDPTFKEGAADAYAAIRLLQKFGQQAAPFLSMISWLRARNTLHGQTKHLTMPVLDKIIADSATPDFFSKLTPDQTLQAALDYAKNYTPEPAAISEAQKFLNADRDNGLLSKTLSKICLSPAANDVAFYAAARFLLPVLKQGEVTYGGNRWKLSDRKIKKYTQSILSRAANTDLSGIFNAEAPKDFPVMEALNLPLLPDQPKSIPKI